MTSFDPAILAVDPERRARILLVLQAALDAVAPGPAVQRALTGPAAPDLSRFHRVLLLGFGKAAVPMGAAACAALGRVDAGVLVTKHGHAAGAEALPPAVAVYQAGHPVPDEAGVTAAAAVAALAASATADDLVLCVVSGGGSALLTLPAPGLSLNDLQAVTAALLRCGAPIHEINAVRKHLEQLKGGQLARLAAPATLLTLVLSDVVGSPLDVIASGPTIPDSSCWQEVAAIVQRYDLAAALPAAVLQRVEQGSRGLLADTPKADDAVFRGSRTEIVADNAIAAQAACHAAQAAGFQAQILTTFLEGEARDAAKLAVALGREVLTHARPLTAPACLLLGGETTVTLRGQGRGGRNQELALAAALTLARIPGGERLVLAALASDGSDGPTDSAGALADAGTVGRGAALGLDAETHLAGNDAYPFLTASGDLLRSGPTQTNVNDLLALFVF
ncbi:MAG: DUF4147 domain-containing protein [Caldilineales bacterium]